MRATIILIVLLVSLTTTVLAEEDPIASLRVPKSDLPAKLVRLVPIVPAPPEPTLRILPEDVVQSSIRLLSFSTNFSTNCFGIVWCYTEARAKKVLAYWDASTGKPKQMSIGSYETTPQMFMFGFVPPLFTSYSQWKEDWLKRRTDQVLALNQVEANAVISALKSK